MNAQVKLPGKLVPVFLGDAGEPGALHVRGAYGGRGSAKTRTFAKMAALKAVQWDQEHITGLIVLGRELVGDVDESSLAEVKAAIEDEPILLKPYFEIGESYVRTKSGRIEFTVAGLKHGFASLKSKARILLLWVDEAEKVSEQAWRVVLPSLREDDVELWVTWNPEEARSATHKRFRLNPPPGSKIVEMNYRDNAWFPKSLDVQRRQDQQTRPEYYDHVWEGGFLQIKEGAYFLREMQKAKRDHRITSIPIESHVKTFTFWDLGIADEMTIWVMQAVGKECRMVGYYENTGFGLGHYLDWLEDFGKEHNIRLWEKHFGPHDLEVRELATGKSRKDWAAAERKFIFTTVPRVKIKQEGIEAARRLLPRVWFDKKRCAQGIEALEGYRRIFNEDRQVFLPEPLHNWASNGADAFLQFGQTWDDNLAKDSDAIEDRDDVSAAHGAGQSGWMG